MGALNPQCIIVGGGPSGIIAGYLLARAGIEVTVLEKHADFFRDFRGDTVHPSTLRMIDELGLLEEFLQQPHQKAYRLKGIIGDEEAMIADFKHIPGPCKFIAMMPQWDFLNFFAAKAKQFPNFHLLTSTEGTDLIIENGIVVGVRAMSPQGPIELRSQLTLATDGRHSRMREAAGLEVEDLGAPMDVLWFALPRTADHPNETMGMFKPGVMIALLNRETYWQCAFVIPKGSAAQWQAKPIEEFRAAVSKSVPFLVPQVGELKSWDDVKLLTVKIDRLREWARPGLLCIGDAAHAMSPAGGVGVNLAVQDAVATANILYENIRNNRVSLADLKRVQMRRMFPTRVTQRMQVLVQDRMIQPVLTSTKPLHVPGILKFMNRFPILLAIPAYAVGIGVRPEHVHVKWRE